MKVQETHPTGKVVCYCPNCGEQIIASPYDVKKGLKCPACDTGFIPERTEMEMNVSIREIEHPANKSAGRAMAGAYALFVLAVLTFVGATGTFFTDIVGDDSSDPTGAFKLAGFFFLMSIGLGILGQLLKIRVALENC